MTSSGNLNSAQFKPKYPEKAPDTFLKEMVGQGWDIQRKAESVKGKKRKSGAIKRNFEDDAKRKAIMHAERVKHPS